MDEFLSRLSEKDKNDDAKAKLIIAEKAKLQEGPKEKLKTPRERDIQAWCDASEYLLKCRRSPVKESNIQQSECFIDLAKRLERQEYFVFLEELIDRYEKSSGNLTANNLLSKRHMFFCGVFKESVSPHSVGTTIHTIFHQSHVHFPEIARDWFLVLKAFWELYNYIYDMEEESIRTKAKRRPQLQRQLQCLLWKNEGLALKDIRQKWDKEVKIVELKFNPDGNPLETIKKSFAAANEFCEKVNYSPEPLLELIATETFLHSNLQFLVWRKKNFSYEQIRDMWNQEPQVSANMKISTGKLGIEEVRKGIEAAEKFCSKRGIEPIYLIQPESIAEQLSWFRGFERLAQRNGSSS